MSRCSEIFETKDMQKFPILIFGRFLLVSLRKVNYNIIYISLYISATALGNPISFMITFYSFSEMFVVVRYNSRAQLQQETNDYFNQSANIKSGAQNRMNKNVKLITTTRSQFAHEYKWHRSWFMIHTCARQ